MTKAHKQGRQSIKFLADLGDITVFCIADIRWVFAPPVPANIADSDWDAQGTEEVVCESFRITENPHLYYKAVSQQGAAKVAEAVMTQAEEAFVHGKFKPA
jgi:hypothetical protein